MTLKKKNSFKSYSNVLNKIKNNRQRRLEGKLNRIPLALERFSRYYPGVGKSIYKLVTASTKVGKSTITDTLFVIKPTEYILNNPDCGLDIHTLYFLLEEKEENRVSKLFSNRLSNKYGISVSAPELFSEYNHYIPSEQTIGLIEKEKEYFSKVLSKITYVTNKRTPLSIIDYIEEFLEEFGHWDDDKDCWVPDNPNLIIQVVLDHASLLDSTSKYHAIQTISNHFIELRNLYGLSPILIQQQTPAATGIEAVKVKRLFPTLDNLHFNKSTQYDVDIAFGIFNPNSQKSIRNSVWNGYDLSLFGDSIRFLEILINRSGANGKIASLYFDGKTGVIKELPKQTDVKGLNKFLNENTINN